MCVDLTVVLSMATMKRRAPAVGGLVQDGTKAALRYSGINLCERKTNISSSIPTVFSGKVETAIDSRCVVTAALNQTSLDKLV